MATTHTAHVLTTEEQNAHQALQHFLDEFGLGSLSTYAWGLMQDGVPQDQVMLYLYDRPEFKERFPALAIRREHGLPPISPAEYIALEGTYRQIMHASGLPASFYNDAGDYTAFIASDISPAELQQRVQGGFSAVANAPPEVRDAFHSYFGIAGDGALAAMFLDQAHAVPVLLDMVARAQVGGAASMLGFEVTSRAADELVDFGVNFDSALQGFRALSDAAALFRETVGEGQAHMGPSVASHIVDTVTGIDRPPPEEVRPQDRTQLPNDNSAGTTSTQGGNGTRPADPLTYGTGGGPLPGSGTGPPVWTTTDAAAADATYSPNDLRAEVEGLGWVFGTDPDARARVERRLKERQAAFAGGGGAILGQEGTGTGAAY